MFNWLKGLWDRADNYPYERNIVHTGYQPTSDIIGKPPNCGSSVVPANTLPNRPDPLTPDQEFVINLMKLTSESKIEWSVYSSSMVIGQIDKTTRIYLGHSASSIYLSIKRADDADSLQVDPGYNMLFDLKNIVLNHVINNNPDQLTINEALDKLKGL
jgi:hypothetical protein